MGYRQRWLMFRVICSIWRLVMQHSFFNIGSWEEPNLSRLRQHLISVLPDGCTLMTIRKRLALPGSTDLVHLEEKQLPMSWGLASVFIAECRRKASSSSSRSLVRDRKEAELVVDLFTMDCLSDMGLTSELRLLRLNEAHGPDEILNLGLLRSRCNMEIQKK